jgi:hypothetical protein
METGLQLLMRDGAVHLAFNPRLDAEQYAELLLLVEASSTKDELRHAVRQAAQRWGKEFRFDDLSR